MQKRFAEYLIFGGPNGVVNKTEAAELAGYSVKRCKDRRIRAYQPKTITTW